MNQPFPVNVYVASSWRNEMQQSVVAALRSLSDLNVYDFKNPEPGNHGFHWSDIDPEWKAWDPLAFKVALQHPIVDAGFKLDFDALLDADICVLVLPSGRSAQLEAGFAAGFGKYVIVLLAPGEPEMMYRLADELCLTLDHVVAAVQKQADQIRAEVVATCEAGRDA